MLARGDQVPHFDVQTAGGGRLRYADVWQRRNLVLVTLPRVASPDVLRYGEAVAAALQDAPQADTEIVITPDRVAGIRAAGVLVADRWGEIHFAAEGENLADLPAPGALADWLSYVRNQCPECQGEAL